MKVYTVEEFKSKLAEDAVWAERALVRLYAEQTPDEQVMQETTAKNHVGFSGTDAGILSSFAQQVQRGRHLSTKQLAIAFKKLPKYAGQLHRLSYPDYKPEPKVKAPKKVLTPQEQSVKDREDELRFDEEFARREIEADQRAEEAKMRWENEHIL